MKTNEKATALFEQGFAKILEGIEQLGYEPKDDPNFANTAGRAARGLADLIFDRANAQQEIDQLLTKTFPANYKEMVISKYNVAFGICPHHLLPVIYRVSLASYVFTLPVTSSDLMVSISCRA